MMNIKTLAVAVWVVTVAVAPRDLLAQRLLTADDPAVAEARQAFVQRMVDEHGFAAAGLAEILDSAEFSDTVLERISSPAERVIPWYEYRQIFMTDTRISAGAEFWRAHESLVRSVAAEFAVAPEIIVAILGVETLFGERMGSYRVLDSLTTLAFGYPPRARFFSSELEQFLLTARAEGEAHLDAVGSYAGAMGAGQFISSSYEAYAVDGDGDGRRDLWSSWPDIVSSVANYFARHDWRAGESVALSAVAPNPQMDELPQGLELDTSIAQLQSRGFQFDTELSEDTPAMLVGLRSGPDTVEYWVGLHNFRVITRYNRSVKYALAVTQLSEAIAAAYETSQGDEQ